MPSDIFCSDIPFHFIPVFQMLIVVTHIAFTTYQSAPEVSVLEPLTQEFVTKHMPGPISELASVALE